MEDPRPHRPVLQALRDRRRHGKTARLIFLVGSFRDELEYDFAKQLPGVSFGELWRRRRWKTLLSLIDQLPRSSRYRQALSMDEDMAEQYIREYDVDPQGADPDDNRPEMAEYDLTAELLLELLNEIKSMRSENVSLQTGKAGHKPSYRKGPKTAYETVKERVERQTHQRLVSALTPRDEHGNRIQPIKADPPPATPDRVITT